VLTLPAEPPVTLTAAYTHVVAGVLTDTRERILLARRLEGREFAGLWEFPGGKVEPGETPEAALIRELREELGIEAEIGEPVICVPHATPRKHLQLDVRRIQRWRGIPTGREGQALAWVQPEKLSRYDMPPADRPVVAALMQPDRSFITPTPGADDASWLAQVETAVTTHRVKRMQVRMPGIEPSRQRALLAALLARAALYEVEIWVNGEPDLAREFNLCLHLRSAQLHEPGILTHDLPLAASCHTIDDLNLARTLGCRFTVLGPVLPTATHPDHPGIGWAGFAALREHSDLPIYALGGLTPHDIAAARQHGAQGIAAIRAFLAPTASQKFPAPP